MPFDSGATVEHHVPERLPAPRCDDGDIVVAASQEAINSAHPNQLIRFLPIVTAVATIGAMAAAHLARPSLSRNPAFMVFPLMMLVSALVTALSGADRRRGELTAQRADYFAYLADMRDIVVETAAVQLESAMWQHPAPTTLWTLAGGHRMWERETQDADFCQVRIGV